MDQRILDEIRGIVSLFPEGEWFNSYTLRERFPHLNNLRGQQIAAVLSRLEATEGMVRSYNKPDAEAAGCPRLTRDENTFNRWRKMTPPPIKAKCALCGAEEVMEDAEEDWVPAFFDLEGKEKGPACPACAMTKLSYDPEAREFREKGAANAPA